MKYQNLFFAALLLLLCSSVMQLPAQENGKCVKKIETEHPHNVHQYTEKLFSGSEPEDEESFKTLQGLGIKTIISVDGAKPHLDLAHQYGMRYVHIPVAYSGISEDQSCSIAKAVRDMTGPIYIHCHHGKHRGPTAAVLSLVMLGEWDNQSAIHAMEATGTGKNYTGLYMTVDRAQKKNDAYFDGFPVEFVAEAQVSSIIETMCMMQAIYDHLMLCKEHGWRSPPNHPDIEPEHEALQLREQFHEFLRTGAAKEKDTAFKSMATATETAARSLEEALIGWKPQTVDEEPPKQLNNILNRITRSCAACHTVFRNSVRIVPQE